MPAKDIVVGEPAIARYAMERLNNCGAYVDKNDIRLSLKSSRNAWVWLNKNMTNASDDEKRLVYVIFRAKTQWYITPRRDMELSAAFGKHKGYWKAADWLIKFSDGVSEAEAQEQARITPVEGSPEYKSRDLALKHNTYILARTATGYYVATTKKQLRPIVSVFSGDGVANALQALASVAKFYQWELVNND